MLKHIMMKFQNTGDDRVLEVSREKKLYKYKESKLQQHRTFQQQYGH